MWSFAWPWRARRDVVAWSRRLERAVVDGTDTQRIVFLCFFAASVAMSLFGDGAFGFVLLCGWTRWCLDGHLGVLFVFNVSSSSASTRQHGDHLMLLAERLCAPRARYCWFLALCFAFRMQVASQSLH